MFVLESQAIEKLVNDHIEKIQGVAFDKDKKIFYTETSTLSFQHDKIERIDTSYKAEDGQLMAELHADLKKSSSLPDIQMKDHRDQYEYKIVYLADENKVEVSQKENGKSEWSSKKIPYTENMTNSVGLMMYIQNHAVELQKLKKKVFRYIIPSRQDDYGMVVEFVSEREHLLNYTFKMENALLRSIVGGGESHLQIDQKNFRITQFEGISNLLDQKDHSVEIILTYQSVDLKAEPK